MAALPSELLSIGSEAVRTVAGAAANAWSLSQAAVPSEQRHVLYFLAALLVVLSVLLTLNVTAKWQGRAIRRARVRRHSIPFIFLITFDKFPFMFLMPTILCGGRPTNLPRLRSLNDILKPP